MVAVRPRCGDAEVDDPARVDEDQQGAAVNVVDLGATIAGELRRWKQITGGQGFLFASPTGRETITKESIDRAYSRTFELAGKHSPHGWRASFSTLAHDAGFDHDAIELVLDHVHSSQVARAYDRGERRAERLRLAAWWDTHLASETPLLRADSPNVQDLPLGRRQVLALVPGTAGPMV